MTWKPDKHIKTPVYKQIMLHFENRIVQRDLLPGAKLPAERELAAALGVNRSTVHTAYEELRSAGLVKSVQGSGTHVSEDVWGLAPRLSPNWRQYTSGGLFLPNQPVAERVRQFMQEPSFINLAGSELSEDLLPVPLFERLLRQISLSESLQYGEPGGTRSLREAIAQHLQEAHQIEADPDQILITSGIQQAFNLIIQCLLAPGDAVALERPSFFYSRTIFTASGLRPLPIPMDEHGIVPGAIRELHERHPLRMIFVNPTYQHPTGTTLSLERRLQLLQIAEQLRIPIIEDDPYSLLTFRDSPAPPPSLMALHQGGDFVIYLGTFSKVAAPGIRIGWLVAPKPVINRLALAKEQMDFSTSSIAQQLTEAYLASEERLAHLERIRTTLTARKTAMLQALDKHLTGLGSWIRPDGGYYVWGKLDMPLQDQAFVEACIRHNVLLFPGTVYGAAPNHVKLVFARTDPEQIEEGVRRMALALQSMMRLSF